MIKAQRLKKSQTVAIWLFFCLFVVFDFFNSLKRTNWLAGCTISAHRGFNLKRAVILLFNSSARAYILAFATFWTNVFVNYKQLVPSYSGLAKSIAKDLIFLSLKSKAESYSKTLTWSFQMSFFREFSLFFSLELFYKTVNDV